MEVDRGFEARVRLASGRWIESNLIIGADGIKSIIRRSMTARNGVYDQAEPTGEAAYRALIPRASLQGDPKLLELLEADVGTRWMGPWGHVMGYPLRKNTCYNMVSLRTLLFRI